MRVEAFGARRLESVRAEFISIVGEIRSIGVVEVALTETRHHGGVVHRVALIVAHLAGDNEVLDGFVRDLAIEHDARACGLAAVVVATEVRRNGSSDAVFGQHFFPVVVASFPVGIAFESLIVGHILIDTPAVDRRHSIAESASRAFLEARGELYFHLVRWVELALDEYIKLVLVVFRHHTVVFLIRNRSVGIGALSASGHRYIVFLQKTGFEKFAHIVVYGFALGERRTPTTRAGVLYIEALRARSVAALNLRHASGVRHLESGIGSDLQFAVLTALGDNHNHAVGSFLTIESRSGSTLKHRHRFDVVRVDVAERRTAAAHGHAIDDDERLIVLRSVYRRDGANLYGLSRVGRATRAENLQTRHLAL